MKKAATKPGWGPRMAAILSVTLCLAFLVFPPGAWSVPLTVVNLAGTWSFTPLGGAATTIQVPGGGWYKQGFTTITQADYQRSIVIPNTGRPQITQIQFGAVNYEADAYINNVLVGTNLTSFTPSVFDITPFVTPGQSYALRVHVKGRNAFMVNGKSTVPNAAGWSPNTPQGIFRSAQLAVYPQAFISDVFVRPSVVNSSLNYDVWITNGSASSQNFTLSSQLTSWNGNSWTYPGIADQLVSAPAGAAAKVTIGPIAWNLGGNSYWWPNVPYQAGYTAQLHNLNLTLKTGTATNDTATVRFGFRDVVQKSDGSNTCYFLNGIRVNFRGDSLQGADYDSIVQGGGPGDAYDTLPGFLAGTNGWPEAVDDYERLNYNFVRLHQEPVSPAMLDTCDQMGLMVMEETAIRGSNNDQDFVLGYVNMVNHLMALFRRDRNHPCIVRLSQSNEPGSASTDSTGFETNLYNAAMSVDGTRPISVDGTFYNTITHANFAEIGHYGNGVGQFTTAAFVTTTMPYGEGEYVWNVDNTKQGFEWFATSTQNLRAQGSSDARPYTLLSAWTSFVPGVATTQMALEQGGHPLYGVDNLLNPWTNSQIQRVQAGFNPVLVADYDYWNNNQSSDLAGDWPANVSVVWANQLLTRNLIVYNDAFSNTTVSVSWSLTQGSSSGPVVASGQTNLTVPLGYFVSNSISLTIPANATNGNVYYLNLSSQKAGQLLFQENDEQFVVTGESQLLGFAFGASPPYATGSEYFRAEDGNPATFYDYSQPNGGYTGIDLGRATPQILSSIVFTPRPALSRGWLAAYSKAPTTAPITRLCTRLRRCLLRTPGRWSPIRRRFAIWNMSARPIPMAILRRWRFTRHRRRRHQLPGVPFGASPPYATGNEYWRAEDGNPATFYDYSQPNGGGTRELTWGRAIRKSSTQLYSHPGLAMNRAWSAVSSKDPTMAPIIRFYTVPTVPTLNTRVVITNTTAFRYLEYVGPANSYCNIAEMAFYTSGTLPLTLPPLSIQSVSGSQGLILQWPDTAPQPGLYYTPSLASPFVWSLVTNTSVLSNGQWHWSNYRSPIVSGFYKLHY